MFKNVHSIAVYAADLGSAVTMYSGLGLEPSWREETQRGSRIGLRYPQGGPEFILHDNAERQFPELTVAVEDLCGLYKKLQRDPGYLWFEPPHPTKQGCAAFVRTPDGNVLSLLSPACPCTRGAARLLAETDTPATLDQPAPRPHP